MKLIIREYLASLKERDELDAILPDLLSEMGLNVFTRPARGTRQHGVDVGAVGSLNGGPNAVYLFSIKPGDITRSSWDVGEQSLRASLSEILDVYIPHCLPGVHKNKSVVVCLCFGGDIQEQVRSQVSGFTETNQRKVKLPLFRGHPTVVIIKEGGCPKWQVQSFRMRLSSVQRPFVWLRTAASQSVRLRPT